MSQVSYPLTLGIEIKRRENGRAGRAEVQRTPLIFPALAATSTYGKEPLLP
jgi:hypothetical protein